MLELSSQLPEYPVVMETRGVGDSLGPQLMAEIGDVTRFARRSSITSFAGVDPGADQSGNHESKSARASRSGPPELRRTLFMVMDCLIQTRPLDDPVYQFMDKKRAEGKPYLVCMTAGANNFLRIYYGKVKDYLASLEQPDEDQHAQVSLHIFPGRRFQRRPFSCVLFYRLIFLQFSANCLLTFYLQTFVDSNRR